MLTPECIACLTASMGARTSYAFPKESILHCRSSTTAIKGNLHVFARTSFLNALSLNPMLWEAFEGLCSLGECWLAWYHSSPDLEQRR